MHAVKTLSSPISPFGITRFPSLHVSRPASGKGDRRRPDAAGGILENIGETPLVSFSRFLECGQIELLVKLESSNPGGSAKDRPARRMVERALASGELTRGGTVIESSSGNMGIGLAQVCNYYGLNFICVVDPNAQRENLQIIEALGATVKLVSEPIDDDFLTARIRRVKELLATHDDAFWPNQYSNDENCMAHYEGTISEIYEQTHGDFDHLFVATSSTGTIQGCQRFLDSHHSSASVTAVDAMGSVLFGGTRGPRKIPGLGAGLLPPLSSTFDCEEVERVSDIDCVVGCRRAAARESTLIGGSAGGVLQAIRRNQEAYSGSRCVAILHDSGTRYLNTVFSDSWVESTLGISPEEVSALVDDVSF